MDAETDGSGGRKGIQWKFGFEISLACVGKLADDFRWKRLLEGIHRIG
jgi:hypothetical protein